MSDTLVTLVVCGAPLASRAADFVAELRSRDWQVSVVGTPSSRTWLDPDTIAPLTGEAPRLDFRAPSQPKRGGQPSAVLVCPATFNSVNKAALGVSDTFALGVLCEALGSGIPTVVVPMVNDKLWGHPAWAGSLGVLERTGVILVDIASGGGIPTPVISGTGDQIVANFDPRWLTDHLAPILQR